METKCSQSKGKGKGDFKGIQRKGMVQRTMVKPWSHVGPLIPIGTAKRMVLRWIRGLLLNLFLLSVQLV